MPRPRGARDAEYQEKRRLLLQRISARLMQPAATRPSVRQMADAAGVTVSTLRHYFGARSDIVRAVFEEYNRFGQPHMERESHPVGPLRESVRAYLNSLAGALLERGVGEIFAVALIEGLLHDELGPASLRWIVDPSVDALARRLEAHQRAGELSPGANLRHCALMLISPMLIACEHQKQMGGAAHRPLEVATLVDDMTEAFVKAYGRERATGMMVA